MTRHIIFTLALLSLAAIMAGCVPQTTDPYTLQAAGNQALEVAHAQMTATAETAIRANESAILLQAQTQASNDNGATATAQNIQAQATGTALYFEAQATQAGATAQAIATQEAQVASATRQALELAQMQAGATSTQTAIITLAERERAQAQREKVVTVGAWIGVFILAALLLYVGFRLAEMFITTAARQRSWVSGADAFVWENGGQLSVIQPRKMFQPALQLDQKTGRATMPQLTAPELQAYTTLAALAVELQREVSKRAQWFTPQKGETMAPMLDNAPVPALPSPKLEPLPMLTGRHVLIAGPTGTGKTHAAKYLLTGRENVTVLDPHDNGATWPENCHVIGGGRDFPAIAESIKSAGDLLDNRFKMYATGAAQFDPVTLAIDELPAIVNHDPDTVPHLLEIAREGRKVNVFLMLLTQSVLVRTLKLEGQSDTRENFATVKLDPLPAGVSSDTPRTATVIIGNLNKPESEEKYLVPALVPAGLKPVPALVPLVPNMRKYDTGTGGNLVPAIGNQPHTAEENELIKDLAGRGYSMGKIADLLGGRRQNTLEKIRAVLGTVSG